MTTAAVESLYQPERVDIWRPATRGFTVEVPTLAIVKDPVRRALAGGSFNAFLRAYYPYLQDDGDFHPEFNATLERLALAFGIVNKALAAPRGIGKTRKSVLFSLWSHFYRHRKYTAYICRIKDYAEKRVLMEEHEVKNNPFLHEDFPEMCTPFINATPNHIAKPLAMSADCFMLPNGTCSLAFGIEGGIRGLIQENGDRPDLIIIDDVEDDMTVTSEITTAGMFATITNGIGGLAEFGGRMSTLFLCTVPAENCIADVLTTPKRAPGWNGVRFPALLQRPVRLDLWERFKALCRVTAEDEDHGKLLAREAENPMDVWKVIGMDKREYASIDNIGVRHALYFYAVHKAEMDEGVKMLDSRRLPVYTYYSMYVIKSEAFVQGEYDQTPPKPTNKDEKVLNVEYLMRRRTNTPRGVVPRWATHVICTSDMGQNLLHYEVDAYNENFDTSQLIECGIIETEANKDRALAYIEPAEKKIWITESIRRGLAKLREHCSRGWPHEDRQDHIRPAIYGVDCGGTTPLSKDESWAWQEVVLDWCLPQITGGRWVALKGTKWTDKLAQRALGRHWICEADDNPKRRHDCHTDWYKTQAYEAYQVPDKLDESGKPVPGAHMFYAAPVDNRNDDAGTLQRKQKEIEELREYCEQQCSEKFNVEFLPGRNVDRSQRFGWQAVTRKNHHWDARWMNLALRDIYRWKIRNPVQRMAMPSMDQPRAIRRQGLGYS